MRRYKQGLSLFDKLSQVHGFDGEDDDDKDEGDGTDENEGDDGDEEESDEEDKSEGGEDLSKLKEALRKERRENRRNARKVARYEKDQASAADKDASELTKAQKALEASKSQNQRLGERLRQTAVDNEITKLATKLKFRDASDALAMIDRGSIEVDQDDEDPSDVEVDVKSVEDALKKLASSKPHLLIAAGDEGPSGGNLGRKTGSKDELTEEELRSRYPVLR